MSWRRFVVLLEYLPLESGFVRKVSGAWTLAEQLGAAQLEALHGANWQRGGGKGPKPKRIPRPGVDTGEETETITGTSMTLDEAKAWSESRRADREDGDDVGS